MRLQKSLVLYLFFTLIIVSCMRFAHNSDGNTIRETPAKAAAHAQTIKAQSAIQLADGLKLDIWATDELAPDPIAIAVDKKGRVYITRTNRQKNSEFDIRGHQDWMTPSIALKTVEDRRAFLHQTFAPERSKDNEWLKDLNGDGSHDWRDLAVEKEEVWRLEDTNHDGLADVSKRVVNDFNDEVSDIAAGILVRDKDAFLAVAPDIWHLEDLNGDGIYEKKQSISHGYGVHIGFSGHNLSGIVEGPDGRIYWNIGDIGGTITTADGKIYHNPNSGFIARANPDGSDFEIFATGLRNTHEFAFDEYGNLISEDNDGDHAGESERLVHIVEGSDAGWRSNWQYGKYTDPKNNGYKVWMDEKLYVPHWEGQAAYIIPPIINYHNGPTGLVYNPGTALGSEWRNKYFVVEFVGNPSRSHIWSFGLKPKGASFELDGEKDVLSGILPTGIQFGPDGALYIADWVNGWNTKDYGRVWKLDISQDKNDFAKERQETQRLLQLNFAKQTPESLYALLFNADLRIRQKAQFELVERGNTGLPMLQKAVTQPAFQLARIHGIWGIGQLSRQDQQKSVFLVPFLKDKDPEIIAQAARMLGDAKIKSSASALLPLLSYPNERVVFNAAEALGKLADPNAIAPLLAMLQNNNDKDIYIRHAGVLALSRIGQVAPIVALSKHPSKAMRTAAVLILRRLEQESVALFLTDEDEYIATEAARAINDDLSIPTALPALAAQLKDTKFTSEAFLRRAINAALRVGGEPELTLLTQFAARTDLSESIKTEALAALGTWTNPSVLDRVDGRYRGPITRDPAVVLAKVKPLIAGFLADKNPTTIVATAALLANLNISDYHAQLVDLFQKSDQSKVKIAVLKALDQLHFAGLPTLITQGMEDNDETVRTTAVGLLHDSNVNQESLAIMVQSIFQKGSIREQQQLLVVMQRLERDKTRTVLTGLVEQLAQKKLSPDLRLELKETIDLVGSEELKAKMEALSSNQASPTESYAEALYGGNIEEGRNIFYYNGTAQCMRCHAISGEGGNVGPDLNKIGLTLNREQILQAIVDPSTRIAPGYGNVALTLKDGQRVYGVLAKESAEELTLITSAAEPLVIPAARIAKRDNLPSSMPPFGETLSKRDIRDLVAFLADLGK